MKKIYFAHPISYYNTQMEIDAISKISKYFGSDYEIINPGNKEIQFAFEKYKKENVDYMSFFTEIINECDLIVCMEFWTGEIGAGVQYEAEAMNRKGGFIYIINKDFHITGVNIHAFNESAVSIQRTRELLNYHNLQKLRNQLDDSVKYGNEEEIDKTARSWPYEEGVLISIEQAELLSDLIKEKKISFPDMYDVNLRFPKSMKDDDEAIHQLSNNVYQASILFFETIGEHGGDNNNKLLIGNGHHMAQSLGIKAQDIWKSHSIKNI